MPRALISVSDKTDLLPLASFLVNQGFQIVSTGGTYKKLAQELPVQAQAQVVTVSDLTGFPEILDGRVKTLHPKVHGGLLANRSLATHQQQLLDLEIEPIDVLVCNLYPFHQAVNKQLPLEETVELIDIGGVTLIRAAAKNFQQVLVITDPQDYAFLMNNFSNIYQNTIHRQQLAIKAFQHTTQYDLSISNYLGQLVDPTSTTDHQLRTYRPVLPLKYGCNPHQQPAYLYQLAHKPSSPLTILQGDPGYINLLDAFNGWQLVSEGRQLFQLPCVASFKHTSPAGVGLGVPLSETLEWVYDISNSETLSPLALAYVRARQGDPKSSFGDFVAVSHQVDLDTAKLIKREVSDGIIAPSFEPAALELLKKKKGGRFLILQMDPNYWPAESELEYRDMFGFTLVQPANRAQVGYEVFSEDTSIPISAQRDLLLANLALKYAQSNNVAFAREGQIIGLAAGQQSRVDCVKLAGQKALLWYLRQHPLVMHLSSLFKADIKRQERVNAIVRYLEGDFTTNEYSQWQQLFIETPYPISLEEKYHFQQSFTDVCVASDAFFPFRDNIDQASKFGVKYILQPGGSSRDQEVIQACHDYQIQMVMTGKRMFTH